MIDVSGTMREYIIKMPAGYNATRPYRLIFAFHGGMYDAASVDAGGAPSPSGPYYGIEPLAGGSAIFVAPQALSGSWTNTSGRDVAYVNAMVARFEAQLCIDRSRIFATGFSFGGIMTLALGCAEADVFRAIAPMSAQIQGTCGGNAPIAYWSSHGTTDTTITPMQGEMARDMFRTRNGCTTQTVMGDRAGCLDYQGCSAGHPLTWCTFTGAHMPAPFAGEAIWAFFSRF
jgi:polyhydroxybutyrate depolymerase